MKLLHVPIQRERPGLCGPYALAAVFRYHGDPLSISELTRRCRATRARGTSAERLAAAARGRRFLVSVKKWAEFSDLADALRRGLPPIVLWFSGDEGHYSVVVGLDRRSVALADPELGRVRRLPRAVFRRVWFDFSTSGPERHARLYARWLLMLTPITRRAPRSL